MAILIEWNGRETEVHPQDPAQGFTLAELYQLTECDLVEIVSLSDGRLMVLDLMGRQRTPRHPVNVKATLIFQQGRGTGLAILGSVLIGCAGEIS